MDRITESLIDDLLINLDLSSVDKSKDFEKLVNYTVLSSEYNKTFDLDLIGVGDGNDTGIDGIAIVVNGQLVENTDEVDDLLEKNNFLEVTYIFTQAKTTSSFACSEINTLFFGIQDFFSTSPRLIENENVKKSRELSNYIFKNASKFRENPVLKIYYVTTGKWLDDANLVASIDAGINGLEGSNLFSKILFFPLGSRELATLYRKTKESISSTITFSNRITIPKINGVSQAYIGLLPYNEFIKIISDNDGDLLNVFEDNVRDFQGDDNYVNGGIASTLASDDSEIFSVLNNGVTIVASTISPTGDQFTIYDYQIVNGCQTSNVLFNNSKVSNIGKVFIPVKLIATESEEVKTRITLATNNQTPIKKEQLAALTQFQRGLEQYYNSFNGENKIYYERRSKQFNTDNTVLKSKIITVPYQIKSFAAMFLDEPHNVTSYFGAIVKKLNEGKNQIFDKDHQFSPYYTSAFAYYRLESFFRKGAIDPSNKKIRFHILMVFRYIINKESLPSFNSKKIEKYCEKLLEVLSDEKKALDAFNKAIALIDSSGFNKNDKQEVKLLAKTKLLLDNVRK